MLCWVERQATPVFLSFPNGWARHTFLSAHRDCVPLWASEPKIVNWGQFLYSTILTVRACVTPVINILVNQPLFGAFVSTLGCDPAHHLLEVRVIALEFNCEGFRASPDN
ncbi:hypothetical protein QTP88_004522 [Uroleucon formosanum]